MTYRLSVYCNRKVNNMPKIITETTTLVGVSVRSIMLFQGAESSIMADICYDLIKDNGEIYETKHLYVDIPPELLSVVNAQWDSAHIAALSEEGL